MKIPTSSTGCSAGWAEAPINRLPLSPEPLVSDPASQAAISAVTMRVVPRRDPFSSVPLAYPATIVACPRISRASRELPCMSAMSGGNMYGYTYVSYETWVESERPLSFGAGVVPRGRGQALRPRWRDLVLPLLGRRAPFLQDRPLYSGNAFAGPDLSTPPRGCREAVVALCSQTTCGPLGGGGGGRAASPGG